jgi:hypothetical protein
MDAGTITTYTDSQGVTSVTSEDMLLATVGPCEGGYELRLFYGPGADECDTGIARGYDGAVRSAVLHAEGVLARAA